MTTARPILFSAPMVRALIEGRKTQTRRLMKRQPKRHHWQHFKSYAVDAMLVETAKGLAVRYMHSFAEPQAENTELEDFVSIPYGVPGDLLWVRETFAHVANFPPTARYYATDDVHELRKKRPAIHMPRWASRLTLQITDIKVEHLQDISEDDAKAEGAARLVMDDDGKFYESERGTHRCGYAGLWDRINGPGSWDANPWVVALTFEVHKANVDAVLAKQTEAAE